MARVKIKFYGVLRELLGKREETLKIDSHASAVDLIRLLSSKHDQKFSEFVFDGRGKLREGFAYAVNGDSVSEEKLASIKCSKVKELVILPPISGG
jgi:molybdopterin converting factor small subunit